MAIDWGTAPAWATVVVATVGTGLALRQLGLAQIAQRNQLRQLELARAAQENQVQIARANLILSIDGEFEGADLYKSRKAIRSLRNQVEKLVDQTAKDKSPDALRGSVAEEFSHHLNEVWKKAKKLNDDDGADAIRTANDQYTDLMILPNWIETVGMLCKRNLLPTADVLDIYDQVVITTMSVFRSHIEARRVEGPYQNPRFLENAYWLHARAIDHAKQQGEPKPAPPVKSQTRWQS